MIKIRDFNNYCSHLKDAVPAIGEYILAATEDHLIKKIKDKTGIVLASVIPSADPDSGSVDNIRENNITFLFVIKKHDPSSITDATELNNYEETQNALSLVKQQILTDKADYANYPFLYELDTNSIHTDPENNVFGGYNGWSISLEFVTNGI